MWELTSYAKKQVRMGNRPRFRRNTKRVIPIPEIASQNKQQLQHRQLIKCDRCSKVQWLGETELVEMA